jgi:NhaA family Na+:H+ antiporter
VVLGLLTPARSLVAASVAKEWAADLRANPTTDELDALTRLARHSASPAERIAHVLHPWSSFVIVPVFALANAGVSIRAHAFGAPGAGAVAAGVILGLVAGKTVGIVAVAWLATRTGMARLPAGASWPMMVAVAAVAGIGFTVSLFVAELAFEPGSVQDAARLGILAASTIAAAVGATVLRWAVTSRPG